MDYDKRLKWKVAEMLREEPAEDYCYSLLSSRIGRDRGWYRRQVRNPVKAEKCIVFIDADETRKPDRIVALHNIYYYLIGQLMLDKYTSILNKLFIEFAYSQDMEDQDWLACIEAFLEKQLKVFYATENTNDFINALSRLVRYSIFEWAEEDYIILQIHNGFDVRCGFTKPYIFKVKNALFFYWAQDFIQAVCNGVKHDPHQTCFEGLELENRCGNWWNSTDAGLHYKFHGRTPDIKPIEENTIYYKYTDTLICKDCGGEIIFDVDDGPDYFGQNLDPEGTPHPGLSHDKNQESAKKVVIGNILYINKYNNLRTYAKRNQEPDSKAK